MQYIDFKNELNQKQYEAVTSTAQNLRIIAGAGSGKTRVLTYRIAYLISEMHVAPWKITAITFTNKVAAEMKSRVIKMIPEAEKDLTIKTFHSLAANFLRREIGVLGFPQSFTILDEEDQEKVIKDIAAEMGYRRGDKIVGVAASYIGKQKLHGRYPEDITIIKPSFEDEKVCLEIYERYEEEKNKILALDFDDLLLKAIQILENYPDIRYRWQQKIDFLLIDEFQDTNDIEFKFVNLLLKPFTSLYVVGDPDQTIYTWRGANQRIILDLEKHLMDMESVILNENYRSTQTILDAANKLIANNKLRIKKDLYTHSSTGQPIVTKSLPSSQNEADYVAREIQRLKESGEYNYGDIVLLYRSNYITREFEASLMARNIPYKIYGGLKFYQRREIKDVLAYFHLIINPKDDVSFERIMNVPKRGIGETATNSLKNIANEEGVSMYEYIFNHDAEDSILTKKVFNSLKNVVTLIETTKADIKKDEEVFSKTLENLINSIGYYEYLLKEDEGDDRVDNVRALFQDIRHFLKSNPEATFDEYLQNVSLMSAQDDVIDGDYVTLMTVHTAKGLEYPVVFVVRFNDGVFPNQRAMLESGYEAIEEERRLAYVALTRAKKLLYLSCASDYSYVLQGRLTPSHFIVEAGQKITNSYATTPNIFNTTNRPQQVNKPKSFSFNDGPFIDDMKHDGPFVESAKEVTPIDPLEGFESEGIVWKIGDIVIHKKLGRGVVVALEEDDIILVNFDTVGKKSIMGNHPMVSKGGNEA